MDFYGPLVVIICYSLIFSQARNQRPSLEFRPSPPGDNGTLIWYNGGQRDNYKYWTDSLDDFLAVYKDPNLTSGRTRNIYACSYDYQPPKGGVCHIDMRAFGSCITENHYNYHRSSPCIFLKLNNINGWVPEYYNTSQGLPEHMPLRLKNYVLEIEKTRNHIMNMVWVSCEGENPADQENIGPIDYLPTPGFPGYFFPNDNSESYLSPLVAVHFQRPMLGIIIMVECKFWARNILHDREEHIGSVHFELLID